MAKLYGVSVGTGDSELITLKAVGTIKQCPVIAYIHTPNKQSMALEIVADYITDDKTHIAIEMPMKNDTTTATEQYNWGSEQITKHLSNGEDVAFLCEGDSLFYGSFMYINERIKNDFDVEIIAGINSVSASASVIGTGLVSRDEILSVIPATADEEKIISAIKNADTVAIVKTNRHLEKIKTILNDLSLINNATCVINASKENQTIIPLAEVDELPYFATIIIKKNKDFY